MGKFEKELEGFLISVISERSLLSLVQIKNFTSQVIHENAFGVSCLGIG